MIDKNLLYILIIEDDEEVSSFIKSGLENAGYSVQCASNGKTGLQFALENSVDLMIVDRMLPDLDGLSIISNMRSAGKTLPVLILSALGEIDDRVKGLKAGGDDYLVKPFAMEELSARIEALIRRSQPAHQEDTKLHAGPIEMDLLGRKVICYGKIIDLQTREFSLLKYLIENKGQIVTRKMLLENVWEYNFDPQTNIIDVHISRLRGKLDNGSGTTLIRTIRGAGYILEA